MKLYETIPQIVQATKLIDDADVIHEVIGQLSIDVWDITEHGVNLFQRDGEGGYDTGFLPWGTYVTATGRVYRPEDFDRLFRPILFVNESE